jgi:hypothetical protein
MSSQAALVNVKTSRGYTCVCLQQTKVRGKTHCKGGQLPLCTIIITIKTPGSMGLDVPAHRQIMETMETVSNILWHESAFGLLIHCLLIFSCWVL